MAGSDYRMADVTASDMGITTLVNVTLEWPR